MLKGIEMWVEWIKLIPDTQCHGEALGAIQHLLHVNTFLSAPSSRAVTSGSKFSAQWSGTRGPASGLDTPRILPPSQHPLSWPSQCQVVAEDRWVDFQAPRSTHAPMWVSAWALSFSRDRENVGSVAGKSRSMSWRQERA